jgi:hypothetical protein
MAYLNYNQACGTGLAEGLPTAACGNNAIGILQAWMGSKGSITAMTINNSGICTSMGMYTGKKLFPLNPYPESSIYTEKGSKSKFGNKTYVQSYEITVASWEDQVRDTIDLMISKGSEGVIKLNNGKMFVVGISDVTDPTSGWGLKCTADWTSGQNLDDELSGVKVILDGSAGMRAYRLDASLAGSSTIFATA